MSQGMGVAINNWFDRVLLIHHVKPGSNPHCDHVLTPCQTDVETLMSTDVQSTFLGTPIENIISKYCQRTTICIYIYIYVYIYIYRERERDNNYI